MPTRRDPSAAPRAPTTRSHEWRAAPDHRSATCAHCGLVAWPRVPPGYPASRPYVVVQNAKREYVSPPSRVKCIARPKP